MELEGPYHISTRFFFREEPLSLKANTDPQQMEQTGEKLSLRKLGVEVGFKQTHCFTQEDMCLQHHISDIFFFLKQNAMQLQTFNFFPEEITRKF